MKKRNQLTAALAAAALLLTPMTAFPAAQDGGFTAMMTASAARVTSEDGLWEYADFKTSYPLGGDPVTVSIEIYAYFGEDTEVEIPAEIDGYPVEAIVSLYYPELVSVKLPESIVYIGDSVFMGDDMLESIEVAEGNETFSSKDGVMYTKDGTELFRLPNAYTEFTVPSDVTTIGRWAFANCRSLTSLTIPETVTDIREFAFHDTPWADEQLAEYPFLIVNGILCDTSKELCVDDITIPDSVTSIGNYAFSNRTKLTSVTIPQNVKKVGEYAFDNCSMLSGVTIEEGVELIGNGAFANCESLTEIAFPDSAEIGPAVLQWCSGLTDVRLPESMTSISNSLFARCTALTTVTIPESVTHIEGWAFQYCESLESITIPEGVTGIGVNAFYYCTALTSIVIPDGVTSIGEYAFGYCTSLNEITFPDSITSVESGAFYETPWLAEQLADNPYVLAGKFVLDSNPELCTGDIILPEGTTGLARNAFDYCENITSVSIPEGVTEIPYQAFYKCSGMTSVSIPVSVTQVGSWAFASCSSLTDVYYAGSEEQWNAIEIGTLNTALTKAAIHFGSGSTDNPSTTEPETTTTVETTTATETTTASAETTTTTTETTAGTTTTAETTTTDSETTTTEPVYAPGDVDGNGKIEVSDAAAILVEVARLGAGLPGELTAAQLAAADLDGNGELETADASRILVYIAELGSGATTLPLEEWLSTADDINDETVESAQYSYGDVLDYKPDDGNGWISVEVVFLGGKKVSLFCSDEIADILKNYFETNGYGETGIVYTYYVYLGE